MENITFDKRNYRRHDDKNKRVIRKSLEEPGAGRSVVIDKEGTLIAGNGVYEQAQKLKMPVRVVETDGSELVVVKRTDLATNDDKRKRLALADNVASDLSDFDNDLLQEDFTIEELGDWGLEFERDDIVDTTDEQVQKDEHVEQLLNDAMRQYIAEYVRMFDYCMQADFGSFLPDGRSVGYAKLQYIKAKFYGRKYDGKNSYIFTPQQYMCASRNGKSCYDAMQSIIAGGNGGIAGFRTMTADGNLNQSIGNQYRVVGGAAADFPPMVARDIFKNYYNGGRVLDPCHGWGGRLVGAMLADVQEYVGVDPSPIAYAGVERIYNAFKEYQNTKVTLIAQPFEDCKWKDGEFDFAFTCPPYFDVEKYAGEDTSTKRYPKFEQWCEHFYLPLIVNTMRALKDDGVFCIVVGSQLYPLADRLKKICSENGYNVSKSNMQIITKSCLHDTEEDKIDSMFLISKQ